MRDKRGNRRTRVIARVALVTAMAGAGLVAVATPALAADAITLPAASQRGPSGGTNTIQITTALADFTASSAVAFSATACAATPTWANVTLAASTTSPFAPTAGLVTTPAANVKWVGTAAKTLEVVVPTELRLVGTQQTTASYYVCVYDDTATPTLTHNSGGATPATAYTISGGLTTLNSYVGPSRGGNTITATSVGGTALASTQSVQFQAITGTSLWAPCATTYQTATAPAASGVAPYNTTAGIVAATSTSFTAAAGAVPARITITVPTALALAGSQTSARYNVCIYAGVVAGTSALISQTGVPYEIVPGVLTSNATRGPSGGTNSIVLTTTATTTGSFVQDAVTVQFQYAGIGMASTCSPTYQTDAAASAVAGSGDEPDQVAGAQTAVANTVRVLAPDRLAVTVPVGVALDTSPVQVTAKYHICAYSGTVVGTSTLIGATESATPYTIGTAATVTAVTPTAGAAQGGTRVTVYGSNFPADLADTDVLIGGVAVTNVVVAADGKSFTATAQPHSVGGPFAISVSTAGGMTTRAGLFTYSNGITVAPNTAPTSRVTGLNVSVHGVDLDTLAFSATTGSTPNSANPHVFLVDGVYDQTGTTIKANHQVAECVNALVVAPDELICTLFPAGNGTNAQPAAGAVTCTDCTIANNSRTAVSAATNPFRKEHVGMLVTGGTGGPIPDGTTIVSVTDASTAVLSNPTTPAITAGTLALTPARTVTDAVLNGTTTLTSATATFVTADVGRSIVGPGIPPGTTIASRTSGTDVVLSQAATTSATGVRTTIGAQAIPVGTYTLTVVSSGAFGSVPTLTKTVISSGSTFTVADY